MEEKGGRGWQEEKKTHYIQVFRIPNGRKKGEKDMGGGSRKRISSEETHRLEMRTDFRTGDRKKDIQKWTIRVYNIP